MRGPVQIDVRPISLDREVFVLCGVFVCAYVCVFVSVDHAIITG